MPTASSLAWKTSRKRNQDAVALQRIKERGALPMIDRGDIRQAIGHCSNIWASLQALNMVGSGIRLTAWLPKFKEASGTVREIDAKQKSPRLSPLWLSSSSACHGLLIITVVTIPTKPSTTKMPELKLANAAITDMQMRQRDVAALDAKYTKELAPMLKLKMMLCVMMLPLVVVGCTSKRSVSQCVKPPPPPAWIMQPPPTGRHRWTARIIHPQKRADHYAKTTGRNPSMLMSNADRVALIDGQLMQLLWAILLRASSGVNA